MMKKTGCASLEPKCSRPAEPDSSFCKIHAEVCPICLEVKKEKLFLLSCLHKFHPTCLKGMIKLECPMCRQVPINVSDDIKLSIAGNGAKYKIEKEEDERRDLLADVYHEWAEQTSETPAYAEVMCAFKYLQQIGIPSRLIPNDVAVNIPIRSTPPGQVFELVVKQIIDYIQKELDRPDPVDSSSLSGKDDDTTDEDDPFEESNEPPIIRSVRTDVGVVHRTPRLGYEIPIRFRLEDMENLN